MIEWDQRYSVEIAEIDREHRQLFGLLNELYAAMQEGQADQVVGKVLDRVLDYAVLHFAHEEALFTQHGYPDAAAHRAEHAELTAQAKALAQRLRSGTGDVSVGTLKFLCDWLSRHILGSDRRYAPFLAQQGVH